MHGCSQPDLELADFKGTCCFVDVGAGLIAGYAGFGLLMNINPEALALLSEPVVGPMLFETKATLHALLLSRGWNVGPQASAGVSISDGYVW